MARTALRLVLAIAAFGATPLTLPAVAQPRLPGVPVPSRVSPLAMLDGANVAYATFQRGHYYKAFAQAVELATKGDGAAMTLIAELYANGYGVPRDPVRARDWYANAVLRGDRNAMVALGDMLMQGNGVPRDPKKAIELYERAASLDHPVAKFRLALAAIEGVDAPHDVAKAKLLLSQAAEAGDLDSQYALASLLTNPDLGTPDPVSAADWMRRAAEGGYVDAEVEYALMLANGKGVAANPAEAARFMRRAALRGSPIGQNRYAIMLANGIGVEMDQVEAARWHLLAKAAGLNDVRLDTLVAGLSDEERKTAQARAVAGLLPRDVPPMPFTDAPIDSAGMMANGVQRPIVALQAGQDLMRPDPKLVGRP